jgi:hypothetical protein
MLALTGSSMVSSDVEGRAIPRAGRYRCATFNPHFARATPLKQSISFVKAT